MGRKKRKGGKIRIEESGKRRRMIMSKAIFLYSQLLKGEIVRGEEETQAVRKRDDCQLQSQQK